MIAKHEINIWAKNMIEKYDRKIWEKTTRENIWEKNMRLLRKTYNLITFWKKYSLNSISYFDKVIKDKEYDKIW